MAFAYITHPEQTEKQRLASLLVRRARDTVRLAEYEAMAPSTSMMLVIGYMRELINQVNMEITRLQANNV